MPPTKLHFFVISSVYSERTFGHATALSAYFALHVRDAISH